MSKLPCRHYQIAVRAFFPILGGMVVSDLVNQNLRQLASLPDERFLLAVRFWAFEGLRHAGLSDQEVKKAITDAAGSEGLEDEDVNLTGIRSDFVILCLDHAGDEEYQSKLASVLDRVVNMAQLNSGIELLAGSAAVSMILLSGKLLALEVQKDERSISIKMKFANLGDKVIAAALKAAAKLGIL